MTRRPGRRRNHRRGRNPRRHPRRRRRRRRRRFDPEDEADGRRLRTAARPRHERARVWEARHRAGWRAPSFFRRRQRRLLRLRRGGVRRTCRGASSPEGRARSPSTDTTCRAARRRSGSRSRCRCRCRCCRCHCCCRRHRSRCRSGSRGGGSRTTVDDAAIVVATAVVPPAEGGGGGGEGDDDDGGAAGRRIWHPREEERDQGPEERRGREQRGFGRHRRWVRGSGAAGREYVALPPPPPSHLPTLLCRPPRCSTYLELFKRENG